MDDLAGLVGVAIVLFATTNIDDIFVLLGFYSDPKFRTRQVVIGQFIGIGALFAVSVIASLISLVLSPAYIGFLGLAPILIGSHKAVRLMLSGAAAEAASDEKHDETAASHGNIVAVALVTMANGGDNISIYTPLFAIRSPFEIAVIGVVFTLMTTLWLFVAHWMTNHPQLGAPIRRYGGVVVPFVLIALGVLILHEAGTLDLVYGWLS